MYLTGSESCSLPNSETPITQQQIDSESAFLNSVGSAFDGGNDALYSLITALGGNPAGQTISGAAGVPTTGTLDLSSAGIPVIPQPPSAPPMAMLPDINDPNFWRWGNSPWGPPGSVGGGWPGFDSPRPARSGGPSRRARGKNAAMYGNVPVQQYQDPPSNCPVVVPLVTAIPIPQAPVQQTSAPVAPVAAVPSPVPVAAVPPTPLPDCRTGNICLDIMNGCVLASQVDPQQLLACSQAGYAGNRNLYPAIAAKGGAGGGAFLGFPDPTPVPYSPGMSGFGQDNSAQSANASIFSSAFEYALSGLIAVVATTLFVKMSKKR